MEKCPVDLGCRERHERPQQRHDDKQTQARGAAAGLDSTIRLPGEICPTVSDERREGEDPDEHGVPVEDADRLFGREVGEELEAEPSVGVERHSTQEIPERRSEKDGKENTRNPEKEVPSSAPDAIPHVTAELDRDAAQDQAPEHEEDREIEAGNAGREHARECHEESSPGEEEPDLVAVPERADRRKDLTPFRLAPRDEEMEGAGAEIETVEDHVGGQSENSDPIPELRHERRLWAIRDSESQAHAVRARFLGRREI